jgi:hypothetical protein
MRVGLMVKNICFLLRGHNLKSRRGYGMYTFIDFTSEIAGWRGVPCPTNKGVSYTNLVCWLGYDLKNRLLLLLLLLYASCREAKCVCTQLSRKKVHTSFKTTLGKGKNVENSNSE